PISALISSLFYLHVHFGIAHIFFRPSIATNVTTKSSINSYAYHSKNLLISYGTAVCFALRGTILGGFAYRSTGVSHNKSFSAILTSTRDMGLTDLFHEQ